MIKKIAVIDIGSNSVRLQISEIRERKRFRILLEEKDNIRLGEEVFETGIVTQKNIEKAAETLSKYKKIIDNQEVAHIRAVATAGFREASNQKEAVLKIYEMTGIKIEIISGIEEARLIFQGVSSNYDFQGKKVLVVDIGGGSCEMIIGDYQNIDDMKSFALGGTRLTKLYLKNNPVTQYEIYLLEHYIDSVFTKVKTSLERHPFDFIIATGGSVNNITDVIYRLNKKNTNSLSREVSLKETMDLNQELMKRTYKSRLLLPGLEEKRADIILAAGIVMEKIMKFYQKDSFISLDKGLRDGLTIDTITRLGLEPVYLSDITHIRERRIWEIAHKYAFDEKHAVQVTFLALKLFDALSGTLSFKPVWREYLKAAAMLHDIGYHISYSKHHKHSLYLIKNSELVGFEEQEIDIIANIARYHRKSIPKISHVEFRELSILDKEAVVKMASLLKIADALDRSHTACIKDFTVEETNENFIIHPIDSGEDLSLEEEGLKKKRDLFYQLFKKEIALGKVQ
ncbi:MAG TPA: hypothetical protein DHW82_02195 [Spirochaetia bacterium]|nr:MAG: hypothetical protein A2Y41_07065 [Spirochaetes bacterium GWB1_36_13]HCL55805.1 hypothetical protein [Spirochaetia bacterium]